MLDSLFRLHDAFSRALQKLAIMFLYESPDDIIDDFFAGDGLKFLFEVVPEPLLAHVGQLALYSRLFLHLNAIE